MGDEEPGAKRQLGEAERAEDLQGDDDSKEKEKKKTRRGSAVQQGRGGWGCFQGLQCLGAQS